MQQTYQLDAQSVFVAVNDADLGSPYNSVEVAPPKIPSGKCAVWVTSLDPVADVDYGKPGTGSWELVADYRGVSLYSIQTGEHYNGEFNGLGNLPSGYTIDPRPDENQVWKDGKWMLDPERLRSQKRGMISAWRNEQESGTYTFEHNGHRWDYGKTPQSRLAPVVEAARAGILPKGFFWTDADNNDVPMDTQSLEALDAAMTKALVFKGFQIHARQRQMKEELEALTTAEEISSYVIGWA